MKNSESAKKIGPFIAKLDDLKKKLLTETEFSKTYTHFLDVLGNDPKFQKIGKIVKSPMLKNIAAAAGKEVTGTGHITNLMLLKVANYPFFHGVFFIDGCMGNLMYFEDINVGLMTIVLASRETRFIRLSATAVEQKNRDKAH